MVAAVRAAWSGTQLILPRELQPRQRRRSCGREANASSSDNPWTKPPPKRFKEILLPAAIERHRVRPIKFERRAALLKSIARGRAWFDEIISDSTTVEDIAARQKCSVRHVNMTISLAFIAPGLVKAAVKGRLPRGIGVAALRDAPAEWSLQFARLGLTSS
jgi:site-specific DNA recombinase